MRWLVSIFWLPLVASVLTASPRADWSSSQSDPSAATRQASRPGDEPLGRRGQVPRLAGAGAIRFKLAQLDDPTDLAPPGARIASPVSSQIARHTLGLGSPQAARSAPRLSYFPTGPPAQV